MQQKIASAEGPLHAKVTIPGSKQMTYRALLLAALADGVSEISGLSENPTTKLFIEALRQAGIVIQLDEKSNSCIIAGGNGKFPKKQATIWCGRSKTVSYAMMGIAAGSQGVYYFDGERYLRQQSIDNLLQLLRRQGVQIIPSDATHFPFTLLTADTLEGGEVFFNRHENRLINTLLMLAPYSRSPFNFSLVTHNNQESIDLTCAMMAEFGVLVHRIHHGQMMVPVPQRYHARDYLIEPDVAYAAYFFAAAAITRGEVTIASAKRSVIKQSTIHLLNVLEKMGCQIIEKNSSLTVKGPLELKGIEISMRKFSDIFFMIAALAPFATEPSFIKHTGTINLKESTRLKNMVNELIKLNIQIEMGKDWIKIFPAKIIKPVTIQSYRDYHMVMAFAVMGLRIPHLVIEGAECVLKVFPHFFDTWNRLTHSTNVNA